MPDVVVTWHLFTYFVCLFVMNLAVQSHNGTFFHLLPNIIVMQSFHLGRKMVNICLNGVPPRQEFESQVVHLFLPFSMLNLPQLPTMCQELCRHGDAEMNEPCSCSL